MINYKNFLRNINLLNIFLIATLILFANYAFFLTFITKIKYALPSVTKSILSEKDSSTNEPLLPSPSDYIIVSEENLFYPERRIPPEKKVEVPLPKPEFVLYGTLITPEASLAYIEDMKAPRNTPGRGVRQTPLRKGDMMSGFILKDVQADKIVMIRGEENMVIAVRNTNRYGSASKQQASTEQIPKDPRKLVKEPPPPKIRAPMKQADERAIDVFKRQRM
jgi:hypothetical protein